MTNRWRVIDRNYKKFVDNKKKTGRGKKMFEYVTEMEEIFGKKKSVHPDIVLFSETIDVPSTTSRNDGSAPSTSQNHGPGPSTSRNGGPIPSTSETPVTTSTSSDEANNQALVVRTPRRNQRSMKTNILEQLLKDRAEYHKAKLEIARERLAIEKEKVKEITRKNNLIEEIKY